MPWLPEDMIDGECIHPACGCGEGPCKVIQLTAPTAGASLTDPSRCWKVYRRPDGRLDFLPAGADTTFEITARDLTLAEAIRLATPAAAVEGGKEITGPIRYVAVRFGDKVVTAPMPGFRHHHILIVAHHLGFKPASPADQGFALADETFIGRADAARVALESGQVKKLIAPPDLYSEDIW